MLKLFRVVRKTKVTQNPNEGLPTIETKIYKIFIIPIFKVLVKHYMLIPSRVAETTCVPIADTIESTLLNRFITMYIYKHIFIQYK